MNPIKGISLPLAIHVTSELAILAVVIILFNRKCQALEKRVRELENHPLSVPQLFQKSQARSTEIEKVVLALIKRVETLEHANQQLRKQLEDKRKSAQIESSDYFRSRPKSPEIPQYSRESTSTNANKSLINSGNFFLPKKPESVIVEVEEKFDYPDVDDRASLAGSVSVIDDDEVLDEQLESELAAVDEVPREMPSAPVIYPFPEPKTNDIESIIMESTEIILDPVPPNNTPDTANLDFINSSELSRVQSQIMVHANDKTNESCSIEIESPKPNKDNAHAKSSQKSKKSVEKKVDSPAPIKRKTQNRTGKPKKAK